MKKFLFVAAAVLCLAACKKEEAPSKNSIIVNGETITANIEAMAYYDEEDDGYNIVIGQNLEKHYEDYLNSDAYSFGSYICDNLVFAAAMDVPSKYIGGAKYLMPDTKMNGNCDWFTAFCYFKDLSNYAWFLPEHDRGSFSVELDKKAGKLKATLDATTEDEGGNKKTLKINYNGPVVFAPKYLFFVD